MISKGGSLSNTQLKKILLNVKNNNDTTHGPFWIKADAQGNLNSSFLNYFKSYAQYVFEFANAKPGDLIFWLSGEKETVCKTLGQLRLDLAQKFNLIDKDKFEFVWVTDFPLLHYDNQSNRFVSSHHPFTSPTDESATMIDQFLPDDTQEQHNQILNLKAKAYDLVCNGYEIGGGSIRIHQPELQQKVFKLLNLTDQEIQDKFGFFIDALRYGTPPHGGIAMGLDRMAMLLSRTDAIRDVIAFPKTTRATCLMSNAPNEVSEQQLSELGLEVKK